MSASDPQVDGRSVMKVQVSVFRTLRVIRSVVTRHLPLFVIGASVAMNLLLANRLLNAPTSRSVVLRSGTVVAPFTATSVAGKPTIVDYRAAVPTILYHFSPTCTWCERNWNNVRALVAETKGRYRVVGVSTTPVTPEFMRTNQLDFDVVDSVTPDVARRYGLSGTPQTIVVSTNGRVLQSWNGVFSGAQQQEVEAYFRLHLPGLDMPALVGQH